MSNTAGVVNVIHVHKSSSDPATVFGNIAGAVNANMWKPLLGFSYVQRVDITPLFDNGITTKWTTDGTSKWHGSASGTDMVPNNAAVVSLKTAERGRSNRGRVFVGPVAEAELTNGMLSSTTASNMVTGWTSFGSTLIAEDAQHVVASYLNATALTVVNYSVRLAAGTVRKRQDRNV